MKTPPDRAEPRYGYTTELAVANFTVSGEQVPTEVITALVEVKQAAARVNATHAETTGVDDSMAAAIVAAGEAVLAGDHPDQFPVDVFQTGSGTSTNMNVNEVLASIATERLGRAVHPNDHVNASQSTNDTFPTAMRLAALRSLQHSLLPALDRLAQALDERAEAFDTVIKAGRTHLMDATPVTLGQELAGYARQIRDAAGAVRAAAPALSALPVGGTATGTGLNAPPGFGADVAALLADGTGLTLSEADDHFAVQGGQDALVDLSGRLRTVAVALIKIADDIRWMASGPRTGLAEIRLPSLQPGSSIMPGKVNPIICEVVTQVGAQVIGNDAAIAFAGTQGRFELNVYLPVIARNLLESLRLLAGAADAFATKCISGIEADIDRCRSYAEASPAIGTALNLHLGYDTATEVVQESLATGRTIRDVVVDRGLLTTDEVDEILDLDAMARGRTDGPS